MGTIKLSPQQAELISPWIDPWVKNYMLARYGHGWLWYWANWEFNHEILF
jgi:hypothetical protein